MRPSQNHQLDVGERRALTGAGVPLRSCVAGVLVFYLLAGALNGHALHESASRREFGPARTAWMTLTAPLSRISRATGLYRFRAWFDSLLEDSTL